jgi:hypothetical protein
VAQIVGYTKEIPPRWYVEKLHKALEISGEMCVDDVCQQIIKGLAQLWVIRDDDKTEVLASALTEVVAYPQLTAVRVIAIGGEDMASWQDKLFEVLCEFAFAQGAHRIEAICRPGLEKIMQPLGFEKRFVCLFKEIPRNGQKRRHN